MAETLAFLAVGTFWFWLLAGGVFALMFLWVEHDQALPATVSVAAALVLFEFFGEGDIFSYLLHNPWVAVGGFAGYLAAGALWSVGKWYFYNNKKRGELKEALASFQEQVANGGWKKAGYKSEEDFIKHKPQVESYKPRLREHASRITIWIMYWPWSMIWTIVSDLVREMVEGLYHKLQGTYQAISDRMFKEFEAK